MVSKRGWRGAAGEIEIKPYLPEKHLWLTQIGNRRFNEEPRWHKEIALSVLTGVFEVEEAVRISFRRPFVDGDRVRYFRIDRLLAAGYLPHPDPHLPHNPHHGCIRAPIAEPDIERHRAWWANQERVRLEEIAVLDPSQYELEGG